MSIFSEAQALHDKLTGYRRFFHENAEVSLDMPVGSAYVKKCLLEMGYEPSDCGSNGVTAIAGGKKEGKTFLLRADMDALPIIEESDLDFKSKTHNMHACGHDFHAAMLLGAAKILKDREDDICGKVKLMFQPGEETMEGALSMMDAGVMDNPAVDAALMIHVMSGSDFPSGAVLFSTSPLASSDWFEITVKGKGCHGAMTDEGVDPLNILSHIFLALQTLNSREVGPTKSMSLTIGQMSGGTSGNIIPDTAYMIGTLRTFSEKLRAFAKTRIAEIAKGVALTFRGDVDVTFFRGCPTLDNNKALNKQILKYTQGLFDEGVVLDRGGKAVLGMGSEDFAFIAKRVPSILVALSAGSAKEGYSYPMHHPKAAFNESVLPAGAAIYANSALRWLEEN